MITRGELSTRGFRGIESARKAMAPPEESRGAVGGGGGTVAAVAVPTARVDPFDPTTRNPASPAGTSPSLRVPLPRGPSETRRPCSCSRESRPGTREKIHSGSGRATDLVPHVIPNGGDLVRQRDAAIAKRPGAPSGAVGAGVAVAVIAEFS